MPVDHTFLDKSSKIDGKIVRVKIETIKAKKKQTD